MNPNISHERDFERSESVSVSGFGIMMRGFGFCFAGV